jgi:hypothetical protein
MAKDDSISHEEGSLSSPTSSRRSDDNDFPQGLPPLRKVMATEEKEITSVALGFINPESAYHAEALSMYDDLGRLGFADYVAQLPGQPRRIGAVLSGVDVLTVRAKRLQRYVRVKANWITSLARGIEELLLNNNLDEAEKVLHQNLSDLLEPVTWFSKRRGVGASQVRSKAETDRVYVRFALDDLSDANPALSVVPDPQDEPS